MYHLSHCLVNVSLTPLPSEYPEPPDASIACAGRMTHQKGCDIIAEAAEFVMQRFVGMEMSCKLGIHNYLPNVSPAFAALMSLLHLLP